MKLLKIVLLSIFVIGISATIAAAGGKMAGNAENGKALFNNPKAFGGSTSCSACHPGGKGLEKAGMMDRTEWKTPVGTHKSLEEAINTCITMANRGTAIDEKSREMKDMVAYIRSLGMKEMQHEMPMKKKSGY